MSLPPPPPPPPLPPLKRVISENDCLVQMCPICKSSLKRSFLFFKAQHCINSDCSNFWKNF